MTLLANVLPRLGSLLTQRGVQAIAAGLLSGAVGGSALVATGLVPLGGTRLAPPTVALMACPGAGGTLAQVTTGQSLLVTARSADGRWLEVYIGEPGIDRAWVPADSLRLQSAADGLPVADCAAPATATPGPLGSPAATGTALPAPTIEATVAPSATLGPTLAPGVTPSPTPRPTATPKPTP